MAFTKTGNVISTLLNPRSLGNVARNVARESLQSPTSIGFIGFDTASGSSSLGGSITGAASGALGYNLASKLFSKSKLKFIPAVAKMLAGAAGYEAGRAAGDKIVPLYRRTPITP